MQKMTLILLVIMVIVGGSAIGFYASYSDENPMEKHFQIGPDDTSHPNATKAGLNSAQGPFQIPNQQENQQGSERPPN